MIKVRYAVFTLMLMMLNISTVWAIPFTPKFFKETSIYGDTLGVDQFWQQLKQHCGKTYE